MKRKYLAIAALLSIATCLGLGVSSKEVHAQGKSFASKESGTLGKKEFDKAKLPGKLEVSVAIGSIITMIAVVKYL